jgi:hypothetical protein
MLFPLSYRRKYPLSLLTQPVYHSESPPTTRRHRRDRGYGAGVGVAAGCGVALVLNDV